MPKRNALSPLVQDSRVPRRRDEYAIPASPEAPPGAAFDVAWNESCSFGGSPRACRRGAAKPDAEADADAEKVADGLVVRGLNALSVRERERIFEEIHGVAERSDEARVDVDQLLEDVATAIKWHKDKDAYTLARFLSPEFAERRELWLAMLRGVDYDAHRAARAVVQHFSLKLQVFGVDRLVKRIAQDDMTAGMKKSLYAACAQVLPEKDRSGRTVVFLADRYQFIDDWRSHFGMVYYVYQELVLSDPDVQRQGVVFLVWSLGMNKPNRSLHGVPERSRLFEAALPVRCGAFHYCFDDARLKPLLSLARMTMAPELRLKTRAHYGSAFEIAYSLMSYGITLQQLPLDELGNVEFRNCQERLRARGACERSAKEKHPLVPTSRCVVFGRGYSYQNFIGNRFLAELIERNRATHGTLQRREKTALSRGILQYIREVRGGKFLKRIGDEWTIADDKEVRERISQGFRTKIQHKKKFRYESALYEIEDGQYVQVPPEKALQEWEERVYEI